METIEVFNLYFAEFFSICMCKRTRPGAVQPRSGDDVAIRPGAVALLGSRIRLCLVVYTFW